MQICRQLFLSKENLISDGQQCHQYQQKKQSLNIKRDMTFEIQVLSWDRHKDVVRLNRLKGFQPSPLDNWIFNNNTDRNKQYTCTWLFWLQWTHANNCQDQQECNRQLSWHWLIYLWWRKNELRHTANISTERSENMVGWLGYGVKRHFQQCFNYIVVVSFLVEETGVPE